MGAVSHAPVERAKIQSAPIRAFLDALKSGEVEKDRRARQLAREINRILAEADRALLARLTAVLREAKAKGIPAAHSLFKVAAILRDEPISKGKFSARVVAYFDEAQRGPAESGAKAANKVIQEHFGARPRPVPEIPTAPVHRAVPVALQGRRPQEWFDGALKSRHREILAVVRRDLAANREQQEIVRDVQRGPLRATRRHVVAITRTAANEAYNLGLLASFRANADVIQGYEWWTKIDDYRACPNCLELHRTFFPLESDFIPPLHFQCRCVIMPVLKGEAVLARKRAEAKDLGPLIDGLARVAQRVYDEWTPATAGVYIRPGQIKTVRSMGGESYLTLKGGGAGTLDGIVVSKGDLPPFLYHVTTNAEAVLRDGTLRWIPDSGAGLGGGESEAHRGVSLSIERKISEQLLRDFLLYGEAMRSKTKAAILALLRRAAGRDGERLGKDLAGKIFTTGWLEPFERSWQSRSSFERFAHEILSAYFLRRDMEGGPENPIFLNVDPKAAKKWTPETVKILTIDTSEIPDDALIIREPVGKHLGEVRVYGEVPVLGRDASAVRRVFDPGIVREMAHAFDAEISPSDFGLESADEAVRFGSVVDLTGDVDEEHDIIIYAFVDYERNSSEISLDTSLFQRVVPGGFEKIPGVVFTRLSFRVEALGA